MPITRPPAPAVLVEKGGAWTVSFVERRARDPKARFFWPEVQKEALNRVLQPILGEMTAHHCAYCDHFQLGDGARETIDHFRPKSVFPSLAFDWENLFPACDVCQEAKGETFDEALLKPDEPGHAFARFFVVSFSTGLIEVNPQATGEERRRAEAAIRIFGLNRDPRPAARRRSFKNYYAPSRWSEHREELHLLPHRFLAPPA